MRVEGKFKVAESRPATVAPAPPEVDTALARGVMTMEKRFEGEIAGRSSTIFVSAFDPETRVGAYAALESFEGALGDASGAFDFIHVAASGGGDRGDEFFLIVGGSGTGELAGISGSGGIAIDADGTHRIWLDYELG